MSELIEGVEIKCGMRTLTVPALTFKALKVLRPKIALLTAASADQADGAGEQFDALVQIVHAALVRNYPGMTVGEVEDFIDLGNQAKLMRAVMGQQSSTATG